MGGNREPVRSEEEEILMSQIYGIIQAEVIKLPEVRRVEIVQCPMSAAGVYQYDAFPAKIIERCDEVYEEEEEQDRFVSCSSVQPMGAGAVLLTFVQPSGGKDILLTLENHHNTLVELLETWRRG